MIETAAIMPFLPGLCRHLLGEDLMLPSVATWWCGQPKELQYVLEHLDQLVAKRAFPTEPREPVFGRKLSEPREGRCSRRSCARGPNDFVGAGTGGAFGGARLASAQDGAAAGRVPNLRGGRRAIPTW